MDASANIDAPMQESKQGTVDNKKSILWSAPVLHWNLVSFIVRARFT